MSYKGKQTLALEAGQHKLEVVSGFPILFSVNGNPEYATGAGNSKIVLRSEEPCELTIEPSEAKTAYSVKRTHYSMSRHDLLDDQPPPEPPAAQNWLAQMRRKVRQEMGVTREHFGLSPYEMDNPEWEENQQASDIQSENSPQGGEKDGEADTVSAEQGAADPEQRSEEQDKA